ncbi:MAG: aminomethyl-transferring glycine dehydrogenase subunit GcvPA [Bacilli bacterium]|nr:aminomethyl-transferring glycine dehydrogenase subunit GcvPA [Bacilli bacterium]
MFKYFPHTPEDIASMLEVIGVSSLDDLFAQINPSLRTMKEFNLPSSQSEYEVRKTIGNLAKMNQTYISFLGAGSYESFTPSVVASLTSRQEFLTAYTPYQPEISQGTLQYVFEFQSMISELTGMDVANASMYDGATATAEAMLMASAHTKRSTLLLSGTLHPHTIEVVKTYAKYRGLQVKVIPASNHILDVKALEFALDEDVAGLIVAYPNYYGYLEDYEAVSPLLQKNKSLFIIQTDPSSLALFKTPRAWGADIVCGEAQSLGIAPSYGGPYLGILATTKALMRKLPGRIVGMTKDIDGKRAFVLTLQAREQHIRREKANSNICSNQSLMALSTVIYMSLMGKQGMEAVAKRAYDNAHYLESSLVATGKFHQVSDIPHHKEFVLKTDENLEVLSKKWQERGFLGGLMLDSHHALFCGHETRSKDEIDAFVKVVGESYE